MEVMTSPFEGPEKKLEIILNSSQPGLRSYRDGRWRWVVEASRAAILSQVSTDAVDAYLLSESSLFVWEDRILMITCGKTVLVEALPKILEIVGADNVAFVFYEQKNFMFPHEQPSRFELDVQTVTRYFPGKFYKLGPANRDHVNVFYSSHRGEAPSGDATLQILMHDLDPHAIAPFCGAGRLTAEQVEQRTGLDRLYPRPMVTDGFLFTPCGYSVNGVSGPDYYTVHVTPQDQASYVSFETNIFEPDYSDTLRRVISIFRPWRFSVVLTTSMDDACLPAHDTLVRTVSGYAMTEKSLYEFDCGYSVSFLNYETKPRERY